MDVAWFDKKRGVRLVRAGELLIRWDAWFYDNDPELQRRTLTLTEALALPIANIHYFAETAWDGQTLWTKDKKNPTEAAKIEAFLSGLLTQEGTVLPPTGWLGWYNLVDSESYPGVTP